MTSLLPPGRLAGIDYGRRRIGIAICDAERLIASPLEVRESSGDQAALGRFFRELVAREEIAGFVVGLPIHADGRGSEMSAEVEGFARWLHGITDRPIAFQDERYTSREAAGLLRPARLTRGRKKARHDAVAAQVILSSWLERQAAGLPAAEPATGEALDG